MTFDATTMLPSTDKFLMKDVTVIFDDPTQRLLVALSYFIFSATGVVGNGLVIFAVLRFRRLRTVTNVFVINLAVSDFVGCCLLPLAAVPYVTDDMPYSKNFCAVMIAGTYTMFAASVVNLALIAVNRYFLVTHPKVRYLRLYRKQNVVVMLICSWVYAAIIVTVPPILGVGALGYSREYLVCGIDTEHPLTSYYTAIRSIMGLVPCLLLAVSCYVAIFWFVYKSGQSHGKFFRGKNRNESPINMLQIKVTRNLFITMCAYVTLISPYVLVYSISGLEYLRPWAAVCGTLNSCVNPIIYGYGHPHFKEAFHSIFKDTYSAQTPCRYFFWRRQMLPVDQTVSSISTLKSPADTRESCIGNLSVL